MEKLIKKLKKMDAEQKFGLRVNLYTNSLMAGLFLFNAVVNYYSKNDLNGFLSWFLLSLCFVLMFLFARNRLKELSKIDYSLPTLTMFRMAEVRYRPFQKKYFILVPVLVLLDTSLYLNPTFDISFLTAQLIAMGFTGILFLIIYVSWIGRDKPMYLQLKKIIAEVDT